MDRDDKILFFCNFLIFHLTWRSAVQMPLTLAVGIICRSTDNFMTRRNRSPKRICAYRGITLISYRNIGLHLLLGICTLFLIIRRQFNLPIHTQTGKTMKSKKDLKELLKVYGLSALLVAAGFYVAYQFVGNVKKQMLELVKVRVRRFVLLAENQQQGSSQHNFID